MSTGTRQTLEDAIASAEALRALFRPDMYERWEIAGSIRRKCPTVGDVEHVVIPRFGEVKVGGGLFDETRNVNLVWHRLDRLLLDGIIAKKVYGTQGFRWEGEKLRGCVFENIAHEVNVAIEESFPAKFAICTGPALYSKALVTGLKMNGYRADKGHVWTTEHCVCDGKDNLCRSCEGSGRTCLDVIVLRDERHFFELAGMPWREPEKRI